MWNAKILSCVAALHYSIVTDLLQVCHCDNYSDLESLLVLGQ